MQNFPVSPPPSMVDIATEYVRGGWAVIPVRYRDKSPYATGWPKLRINTPAEIVRCFAGRTNIGVILGTASGGLVDVDLDCPEALAAADSLLPPTPAVFGRPGKPRSHRLYRVAGAAPTKQFADPVGSSDGKKNMLVEFRGDPRGGEGVQTVFPGSVHESGEPIEWAEDGEPALVDYADLLRCVRRVAATVLLARYFPEVRTTDQLHAALSRADPKVRSCLEEWLDLKPASRSTSSPSRTRPDLSTVGGRAVAGLEPPPLTLTEVDVRRLWTALTYIPSHDRQNVWIRIGGALHDIEAWPEELRRAMWNKWSIEFDPSVPKKYDQQDSDKDWESFSRPYTGEPTTVGSIFALAQQAGWNGSPLKPLPDEWRRFIPHLSGQPASAASAPAPAAAGTVGGAAVSSNATPGAAPADFSSAEDEAEIRRLSMLAPLYYGRERREAAKRLGVSVDILDKTVRKARRDTGADVDDEVSGGELRLLEPEPWPDPVDGYSLVQNLIQAFRHYVVTSTEHEYLACALWNIHTYVFDLFTCTPRLCVNSPEPACGKSTVLRVSACLANRPLQSVNITPAGLFRVIEAAKPTTLHDEADTTFRRTGSGADTSSDLLHIANGGHAFDGYVVRVEGDARRRMPRVFRVFAPLAIALIGELPASLRSRSIVIRMRRKFAGEKVAEFRPDRVDHLHRLAQQIRRWSDDHYDQLRDHDPAIPEALTDGRTVDNWRPLFAIADLLGWGAQARAAALHLAAESAKPTMGLMLLADIRDLFRDNPKSSTPTSIWTSSELVELLAQLVGRPWADFSHGRTLTTKKLAEMLESFEIKPDPSPFKDQMRRSVRGYRVAAFEDAFARYLT